MEALGGSWGVSWVSGSAGSFFHFGQKSLGVNMATRRDRAFCLDETHGGLLERSGHDQIRTFGPISHVSGPEMVF